MESQSIPRSNRPRRHALSNVYSWDPTLPDLQETSAKAARVQEWLGTPLDHEPSTAESGFSQQLFPSAPNAASPLVPVASRANGPDGLTLFEESIFDTVSEPGGVPAGDEDPDAEYVPEEGEEAKEGDEDEGEEDDDKQLGREDDDDAAAAAAAAAGPPGETRAIATLPVTHSLLELCDNVDPSNEYWAALHTGGFFALGQCILREEIAAAATLNGKLVEHILRAAYIILASTPRGILLPVVRGNLGKAYYETTETYEAAEALNARLQFHPAIYQLVLHDCDQGLNLTNREAGQLGREVIRYARSYRDDSYSDVALLIDTQKPGPRLWQAHYSEGGRRKYLEVRRVSNGRMEYSQRHADALENQGRHLVAIAESAGDDMQSQPLKYCLSYVGYSNNADARATQHEKHQSSNFLMNAVEAVAMVIFEGRFSMFFYPVSLVCDIDHAELAEIIFTRLAHGYVSSGYGFSHHPAGRNNRSIDKVPARQWREYERWIIEESPLIANHEAEMVREGERYAAVVSDNKRLDASIQAKEEAARKTLSAHQQEQLDDAEREIRELDALIEEAELALGRRRAETLAAVEKDVAAMEEMMDVVEDVFDELGLVKKEGAEEVKEEQAEEAK